MVVRVPVWVDDVHLERIGEANPGWKVELVGGDVVLSPANSDAARRNARLGALLASWSDAHGYVSFDSSAGFRTGPSDVLSPDAALISCDRWKALSEADRRSYAPLVPDIVVELISAPHDARAEHEKCARWFASGARFVVAINPYAEPNVRTWGTAPADFPSDWSAIVG